MYVILNIHHDTSTQYYYPSSTYKTQSVKFVNSIWTQVAKYFKDYDQKLIFETLNEPRLVGTGADEWWFPVNNPNSAVRDSISVINTLNQTAVDVIRQLVHPGLFKTDVADPEVGFALGKIYELLGGRVVGFRATSFGNHAEPLSIGISHCQHLR